MDLQALSDFNAVVAHGGFGRASRATGRPKASLSRRVMQLEQALGVRLLQRGTRTLVLTEEGATLYSRTTQLLGEIDDVADAVSMNAREPSGRLRISAPTVLAYETLGRLSAAYIALYPNVRVEVIAEDRFVDLIAEDYDVVIRANPATDTELAGRCFFRDDNIMVAPPKLASRLDGVADVDGDGAATVPAVTLLSAPDNDIWRVPGAAGVREFRPRPVARFSSISMVCEAALAGAGAALLPSWKARPYVESGRLKSFGAVEGRSIEVWALFATRRQLSPKIGAFVQLLVDAFANATPDTV
jgi:DNA-binding transcriptional LysR family regulator